MAVERWQLRRNYEIDNGRCAQPEAISQPHAAHGRGPTYTGTNEGPGGVRVEFEPLSNNQERVGEDTNRILITTRLNVNQRTATVRTRPVPERMNWYDES